MTLIEFLQNAGNNANHHFFIQAQFPDGSVVDLKYKFANEIITPARFNKYLGNFLTDIINVLDDGGFGTFIIIGEEN